jgi:hypothetical protein
MQKIGKHQKVVIKYQLKDKQLSILHKALIALVSIPSSAMN